MSLVRAPLVAVMPPAACTTAAFLAALSVCVCVCMCSLAARRRCRHWPRCPHCLQQLTPDMETLIGTSCLLFLGFCAASWQLIQAWAVADRLAHGREL
jgi:hypothetical protein